ncbi:MAG: translation initiation factor IF-2 [Candidatus Staskawiczbacteria bacterium RIFOXYB2_FULL_32_9]|uniref:Translation initiation factor IF-2 n=1 Tax=Candidatus Staskawiczbacteria bacterium RIFOXYD1_FULL_32_13 TaxID=1802234 RepID=A0A1G2JLZ8_9BACT|nr:MAG: Translation initiation factor IF-2 [Parcubacteria group bacterium GW2011_GWC2_32_10]OGJ50286.1 MAG: translation initiation factor IF-2 [Candidatus Peregrinibacteria bacterium RIFOXYA2_FULL_33_7]OGZ78449.1 MAG: translation initiation factor IF-2 [Candidatus Staskawiczbacteria bacterium RIFOXYB1_FULL_32_11]OGZ84840.1 MAG: translation initiation factor IF-2 [Candidatus Staskawiczbacteria bacterium RIFOXYB2_FULL_32_9]OGZ87315.1 MAG: translation initiation factor IF-2 [Candidatus Staskawiczb
MAKKAKAEVKNILQTRPPVVVVLGHVDHGKSSLLEAIRDFKITAKESGGITQHIGAYEIDEKGKKITFIDTPGHEAFSAMRARGTEVADVALLVIDSAQSVQPQTKEAINVIKRSEIPMIVVLNKIDLPNADPEKIKRELSKVDIFVESMGGEIPSVEVSAKEKTGIDELLEMILLISDLKELKSETDLPVEGLIIESYMDAGKGPVATAIIKKGILNLKDIIATDIALGKVRGMQDFQGKQIQKALPSQPVVILGFEKVPAVGEKFKFFKSVEDAQAKLKIESQKREINVSVIDNDPSKKIVNIILKGDVFGSIEAIEGVLKNLPQEKVILRILKSEVGDINETDIKTAEMVKAQIIGFRVKISPTVVKMMQKEEGQKIRIKTFNIIYDLIQEVRFGMEKSLEAEVVRRDIGKIRALVLFFAEKNRQIVGGKIQDGEIKKGLKLEIFRNNEKVGSGRIIELQRDKKVVDKLSKGDECGILFEGNTKIEKDDILVAFIEERKKSEL